MPLNPGGFGLVKLGEVTLAGAAATIDFTNIDQSCRTLELDLNSANDTGPAAISMRFSSDGTTFDGGTNYDTQLTQATAAAVTTAEAFGSTAATIGAHTNTASLSAGSRVVIQDYTNTTFNKHYIADANRKDGVAGGNLFRYMHDGYWRNSAAIKGIRLLTSNNFAVGTRATLWGRR